MRVWIQLLGPVQLHVDGQHRVLPPRLQRLLVGLIRANGQPVARASLLESVWDKPSDSASQELDKLMTNLKRELGTFGLTGVVTSGNKQTSLNIAENEVDVHLFEQKIKKAAQHRDDDRETAKILREALALFVGEPLEGLDGLKMDSYRQTLKGKQHAAMVRCFSAELRLGHHKQLLPEIAELDRIHPLDEQVSRILILARYRTHGRDDALNTLRVIDERWADQLGVKLSPTLQNLRQRILIRDPALMRANANEEQPAEPISAAAPQTVAEGPQDPAIHTTTRPVTIGGVHIQAGGDIRADGGIIAGGDVTLGSPDHQR